MVDFNIDGLQSEARYDLRRRYDQIWHQVILTLNFSDVKLIATLKYALYTLMMLINLNIKTIWVGDT